MKNIFRLILLIVLSISKTITAQETDALIVGDVQSGGDHIPFANIIVEGTTIGTTTDQTGHFMLPNMPVGTHIIRAQAIGFKAKTETITIQADETKEVKFVLEEEKIMLDQIVVTGTRTFKRQTDAPVIVSVLDGKLMEAIQAQTVSEGLCFQPGLRVETDCQTCNYTQLRMNGLGGAYSQILINSRPVFSALNGLYGLEQIPANMIEQIEVVRGGGSALYGSSAIGGTVNIITKIPTESSYSASYNSYIINNQTADNSINVNASVINQRRNAGVSLYASQRNRDGYDHDGDGFTEIPTIKNNSFGFNSFYKPTINSKLEFNFSSIYEYRRGGNNLQQPAHEVDQAEERTHNVIIGGINYDIDFKRKGRKLSFYVAGQDTRRQHYTGILPDSIPDDYMDPYGNTRGETYMGGVQYNLTAENFLIGSNSFTFGAEANYDDVLDVIPAYSYEIDQTTKQFGLFAQSDWALSQNLVALIGLRADKHNFVDHFIFNPRISFLYKIGYNWQFRTSYSTGFRAPQAFDADMHIAFSGGGIQKILLDPNLKEETSGSYTASVNFNKPTEKYIYGFTIDGFYTKLNNAFILEEDLDGNLVKLNGGSSVVKGITFEVRGNYNRKFQIESGFTIQESRYNAPVAWSAEIVGTKNFLRTPSLYGFYTLSIMPTEAFNASISGVITGPMEIPHFAGAPGVTEDNLVESDPFHEVNFKISYTFSIPKTDQKFQLFAGIQNIFNHYQNDFDTGKNRDSGYIYGPAKPRTLFFGIKLGLL